MYDTISNCDYLPKIPKSRALLALSSLLFWVGYLFSETQKGHPLSRAHLNTQTLTYFGLGELLGDASIHVSYDYSRRDGPAGVEYPFMHGFDLVEPYREVTMCLSGLAKHCESCEFSWEINNQESREIHANASTENMKTVFTVLGKYTVNVIVHTSSSLQTYQSQIICKYVRRELRTLFPEDREAYFESSKVIWDTSTTDGQKLYGDRFQGIEYFVREHNNLAGQRECDHIHDGLGFLTQHAAMSLEFERALQSVNSRVTVPYWDYTIESSWISESGNNEISSWYSSEVFSDDWFGETSPAGYIVNQGRWAYTPAMSTATNQLSSTLNAYGFLRAPWNQNNIPFLTRHNKSYGFYLTSPPGCKDHYDQMKLTTFAEFGTEISYKPHGKTHTLIGGVWGADWSDFLSTSGYSSRSGRDISTLAFVVQKAMWRAQLLDCPKQCSAETPLAKCKCTCPSLQSWLTSGQAKSILQRFNNAPGVNGIFSDPSYTKDKYGADFSGSLLRLFCNDLDDFSPVIGDSLESASPLDVSFWSIHPTVERLWLWRRVLGMTNDSWVDNDSRSVNGFDVGYCWGHNEADVVYWKNLQEGNSRSYTNRELYDYFDPKNGRVSFVYDTFQWSHCESQGFPKTLVD